MICVTEITSVSSLRDRLQYLMRYYRISGQKPFAKYVSVSFNTLKEVFRDKTGRRGLSPENYKIIAAACRCNVSWLMFGSGEPFPDTYDVDSGAWAMPDDLQEDELTPGGMVTPHPMTFVPKIRPHLLIRGESPPFEEDEIEWFAFPSAHLAALTENLDALRILRLECDLMFPLLKKDDLVLVDCQKTTIEDGKIYVFISGRHLRVAELQKTTDGKLLVRPRNPVYSSFEVTAETVRTVGQCLWYGRVLD